MSTNESDSKQSATSLRNVVRELEAVMMVAEEPMAVVSLATALDVPVAEIKKALAELVADYDGELGGPERGFELREVGGGWRIYVRESFDSVVANAVAQQHRLQAPPPLRAE